MWTACSFLFPCCPGESPGYGNAGGSWICSCSFPFQSLSHPWCCANNDFFSLQQFQSKNEKWIFPKGWEEVNSFEPNGKGCCLSWFVLSIPLKRDRSRLILKTSQGKKINFLLIKCFGRSLLSEWFSLLLLLMWCFVSDLWLAQALLCPCPLGLEFWPT